MHRRAPGRWTIVALGGNRRQEPHWLNPDPLGNAFDAFQRQVVLAALQSPEVGSMDANAYCKRLLAETLLFSVGLQAQPYRTLKVIVDRCSHPLGR